MRPGGGIEARIEGSPAAVSGKASDPYQPVNTSAPAIMAPEQTILFGDIAASLEMSNMRVNRCRRRAKGEAGWSTDSSANARSASR
jgi:hypothetical protein